MFIPIAEYRPDVADINTNYTDEIRNVLPADGSYMPVPSFLPFTQPFPEAPLGSIAARSLDGAISIFAGTASKLYMLNNTDNTWNDVSKDGGTYSANVNSRWSFAVFGNYVIAVNKNDAPQVFELGSSSEFKDLGGNPPRAGVVKVWGDFVSLMQLPDNPNRVYWSGLNDAEWWTVGQRSCDYQDFPDGGIVQGSNETTNPIIFLQTAIYLATFVPGSDIIFSFQKIHDKRGAKSPWSIACRGAYAFYADEGGFFQIASDGALSAIGFEKVDRHVFSRANSVALSDMFGAIDPFYSRVYWAVDYSGRGILDELLIYDWGLQMWSVATINASAIMPIFMSGYTLDGLDNVSDNVDALPFSLDSKAWQGGAPVLGSFSTDYRLCSLTGPSLEAVVTTPELGDTAGSVQRLNTIYPITDTNTCFVSIGARFRRNVDEPVKWDDERPMSFNTGATRRRSRARFHKFRIRIPENEQWTHIKGLDVVFSPAGLR